MNKILPQRRSCCYVANCTSQYGKSQGKITMFGVPKDPKLREKWNRAIGHDKELTPCDIVCEKHFREDDIIRYWTSGFVKVPYTRPKLRNGAIPSICSLDSNQKLIEIVDQTNDNIFEQQQNEMIFDSSSNSETFDDNNSNLSTSNDDEDIKPKLIYQLSSEPPELAYFDDKNKQIDKNNHHHFQTQNKSYIILPINTMSAELINMKSKMIRNNVQSIFDDLFNKKTLLHVPPLNWAYYSTTNENSERILLISEMVIRKHKPFLRRQLIVNSELKTTFIVGLNKLNETILQDLQLKSQVYNLHELETLIKKFTGFRICNGGPTIDQFSEYEVKPESALVDRSINRWRHLKCSFVYDLVQKSCKYCRTLHNMFYKQSKRRERKNVKFRCAKNNIIPPNSNNVIRELRLVNYRLKTTNSRHQSRIKQLMDSIKNCKKQLKELSETKIFDDLAKLKLTTAQKLLITECIKSAKCKIQTTKRHTNDWILFCIILYSRSRETYKFLYSYKILPLCDINTVKRHMKKYGNNKNYFDEFKQRIVNEFIDMSDETNLTFSQQQHSTNFEINLIPCNNMPLIDYKNTYQQNGDEIMFQNCDNANITQIESEVKKITQNSQIVLQKDDEMLLQFEDTNRIEVSTVSTENSQHILQQNKNLLFELEQLGTNNIFDEENNLSSKFDSINLCKSLSESDDEMLLDFGDIQQSPLMSDTGSKSLENLNNFDEEEEMLIQLKEIQNALIRNTEARFDNEKKKIIDNSPNLNGNYSPNLNGNSSPSLTQREEEELLLQFYEIDDKNFDDSQNIRLGSDEILLQFEEIQAMNGNIEDLCSIVLQNHMTEHCYASIYQ